MAEKRKKGSAVDLVTSIWMRLLSIGLSLKGRSLLIG
jgi:hypothetical protein